MDRQTLLQRAETWRRRAIEATEPKEQIANLLLADHYQALADAQARRDAPDGRS